MIKRVLVAVAGTAILQDNLDWIVALARRHSAQVSLLSVVQVAQVGQVGPVPIGAGPYAARMSQHRLEEALDAANRSVTVLRHGCERAHLDVGVIHRESDAIEALIAAWRYHDLCLIGAHGWFDEAVLAPSDAALLRAVRAGVRPLLALTERTRPVQQVVIAYNGSAESAKAMKQFVQLRLWPEATLHIVCVGDGKTGEPAATLLGDAAQYGRAHGHHVVTERLDGAHPAASVRAYAASVDADLHVAGSSFRTMLSLHRFGRNTRDLLHHAERPVFLSH